MLFMRRTLVLIVAGIIIALILVLVLIFGTGGKSDRQTPVLNGSEGTRSVSPPSFDTGSSQGYAGGSAPAQTQFQYYTYAPAQGTTAVSPSAPSSGSPSSGAPQASVFTFSTYTGPTLQQVLNTLVAPAVQPATTTPQTYDGVTTPPAVDMWPSQGDGIIRGGGTPGHGRPDYEFNPYTGDGRIGDYNFSLAAGTIVNGNTSNNAGDPDNLVFGSAIGTIIGGIVGMPDLGGIIGTGIGSNLFPGYRLSNFGISVQNGIPTFDGIPNGVLGPGGSGDLSSIAGGIGGGLGGGGSCLSGAAGGAAGGSIGGSAGSAVGGAAGGGGGYQGGMVVSIPCTCSKGNFWWTISSPTQYAGTYLYEPLSSRLYENYMFVGTFNNIGSHGSGEAYCSMYAGEDCIDIPMTCGKLNGSPGTGTSVSL